MPAGRGGRGFGARCAFEGPRDRLRGRLPQDRALGRGEGASERRASPPPCTGGVRTRGRRGGPCARAFLRARGRRALCRRARAQPPRPRAGPPRDRRRAFRPRHRSERRGRARGCRRGRSGRGGARARSARASASAREEPARRGVSPPCAEGVRGRRRRIGRAHVERIPKGLSALRPKPLAKGLEEIPSFFPSGSGGPSSREAFRPQGRFRSVWTRRARKEALPPGRKPCTSKGFCKYFSHRGFYKSTASLIMGCSLSDAYPMRVLLIEKSIRCHPYRVRSLMPGFAGIFYDHRP